MRVQNGILMTMEGTPIPCGYVDFEDGKITGCGAMEDAPAYSGEVLDAKGGYILPGFIDAHTHIGISEEGLRWEGEDCNETTGAVTAEMRVTDGFNPFDTAIAKARRAGVTAAGVSPGSTNVIGGQIAAVKLCGRNIKDMVIKAPAAIKFALGENPKRNYGNSKGSEPMTRMAVAAVMRRTLEKARRYAAKKEAGEDVWDDGLEPLLPLLRGEIPAHFHAHRADDMLTAIRKTPAENVIVLPNNSNIYIAIFLLLTSGSRTKQTDFLNAIFFSSSLFKLAKNVQCFLGSCFHTSVLYRLTMM